MGNAVRSVGSAIRNQPLSRLIGVGVFIFVAAVLIYRNQWMLHTAVFEDGDLAANSILVDKARVGEWLVGHYSRAGFYHPGPFFLYVQGLGEFLFFDLIHLTPTPYNAQFLGVLIVNSAFIGVCTAVVGSRLKTPLAALWVPGLLLAVTVLQPGALVLTWPPYMVILPFAMLMLSTASTLTGKPEHLPIVVLAMCILVHGHASFIPYCAIFALIVGIVLAIQVRQGRTVTKRWTFVASGLVLGVFILPIALNTFLNWPGELPKYLANSRGSEPRSVTDVVQYMAGSWIGTDLARGALVAAVVVCAVLGAVVAKESLRRFLFGTLALCGVATILTFAYAYTGVDSLTYGYLIAYYSVVPCLVLLVAILGFTSLLDGHRWASAVSAAVGGVLGCVILLGQPSLVNGYPGSPQIVRAETAIAARIPADELVVVQFNQDAWPLALGLIEQYHRTGRDACLDGPKGFQVNFAPSETCVAEQIAVGRKAKLLHSDRSKARPEWVPLGDDFYMSFPGSK